MRQKKPYCDRQGLFLLLFICSLKSMRKTSLETPYQKAGYRESRNVPSTDTALPRWIYNETRWRRNSILRRSPNKAYCFTAIVFNEDGASLPQDPNVSNPNGKKMKIRQLFPIFPTLSSLARLAAPPASVADALTIEKARVHTQVTSHVRGFPAAQGVTVTPSGRRQSDSTKQKGSKSLKIPAPLRARFTMRLVGMARKTVEWFVTTEGVIPSAISSPSANAAMWQVGVHS